MTESSEDLEAIQRAASSLIPELADRLRRRGLGEIEVRSGELRVRVSAAPARAPELAAVGASFATPAHPGSVTSGGPHGVPSPAVGYFVYGEGLGPGLAVEKGDALGFVEVLGVRHDVRAPRSGTVRNLVTETGEAVEYGQTLLELEAADA
jgi:acetyl-CoA carboxylase biotin carboxyl carrier protein